LLVYIIINTLGNLLFLLAGVLIVYTFANKSKPIEVDKTIFHKEPVEVNPYDLYEDEEAFVPNENGR